MENLKLHAEGNTDHVNAVKEKYAKLKEELKANLKIGKEKKQVELESLNEKLKKEILASN